ncbi:MAG: two-component system, OmpR family, sensor histidine kinase MprB [Solirubrobacteraceae bacterium]|nr:two-component system, OmpR family, sensor histidine kinase MprB [Solirubrobacteraceae bacterium]
MKRLLGLRTRLLAALLATSLVTLGAAALVLLPPLREKLRTQAVRSTLTAVTAQIGPLEEALKHLPKDPATQACDLAVGDIAITLTNQTGAKVSVVDNVPRPICGLEDLHVASNLLVQQTLTNGVPDFPRNVIVDNTLLIVLPLSSTPHPTEALVLRKPLTDVAGAVAEVRKAFEKAAVLGLLAALILGLAVASTLLRRLERLRRAALRVTTEGAGAPHPRDDGRDEIGDLARSFAAMQDALLRQEEARRAFVATASHELRTPLTSLSGMLELLDEDLAEGRLDTADAQDQIARARGELRRLGNLAAELLDLSRLDAGVPMRSEPVELGEITRAVGSEFEQRARDLGVGVDVLPPIAPCWAMGDPGAIARILRILIDNALRFSPRGQAVRVAVHYRGDRAALEVSDHGPGVPADEREVIFARFQRGSRTGGEGGFGLGLAIGRELAVRLGGTLDLLAPDAAHPGAWFVLELPIEMPAGGSDLPPIAPARSGSV